MFRRFEVINGWIYKEDPKTGKSMLIKKPIKLGWGILRGIVSQSGEELPYPKIIRTHKRLKSYFTEAGWKKFAKGILEDAGYCNWLITDAAWKKYVESNPELFEGEYAISKEHPGSIVVTSIKEKSVDVVYRDKYQVIVRPRKKQGRVRNRADTEQ